MNNTLGGDPSFFSEALSSDTRDNTLREVKAVKTTNLWNRNFIEVIEIKLLKVCHPTWQGVYNRVALGLNNQYVKSLSELCVLSNIEALPLSGFLRTAFLANVQVIGNLKSAQVGHAVTSLTTHDASKMRVEPREVVGIEEYVIATKPERK